MNRWKTSLFAAMACGQIFTGSPEKKALWEELMPMAELYEGSAQNMPADLAAGVTNFQQQGFYVMHWELSASGSGYMVDLYHSDPRQLKSDRDDVRAATLRGWGFNLRKYIPGN